MLEVIYSGDEGCVLCGNEPHEDKLVCNNCEKNIKFCEDGFKINKDNKELDCYSLSFYSNSIKELVLRLKYKSDFRAGEALALYMANFIKSKDIQFDVITYIPMSKQSLKKRGYNQGEYLAKIIGEVLNKPVIHCLDKVKQTKDQIGLSGDERWNNIIGSFSVVDKINIKSKKILIVDDVITTGATAFSCYYELKKNESDKITVLTAAKSKV